MYSVCSHYPEAPGNLVQSATDLPTSSSPGLLPPDFYPNSQSSRSSRETSLVAGALLLLGGWKRKMGCECGRGVPWPILGCEQMPGPGPEGGLGWLVHEPTPFSAPRFSLFFSSRRQVPPAPPQSLMSSQTLRSCCWNRCPHLKTNHLLALLAPSSSSSFSSSYLPPHSVHWRRGGKQGLDPAWTAPSCLTEEPGKP